MCYTAEVKCVDTTRVGHRIIAPAIREAIGIISVSTIQRIVTGKPSDDIIAIISGQEIVEG